jgi:hypothetical protein
VTSALFVAVRPQNAEQAFPSHPSGPRDGQECEQGEPAGRENGGLGPTGSLDPQPTERSQPERVTRVDCALI